MKKNQNDHFQKKNNGANEHSQRKRGQYVTKYSLKINSTFTLYQYQRKKKEKKVNEEIKKLPRKMIGTKKEA